MDIYETDSIWWYNHTRDTTTEINANNRKGLYFPFDDRNKMSYKYISAPSSKLERASLTHITPHIAKKIDMVTERIYYIEAYSRQNLPNKHMVFGI